MKPRILVIDDDAAVRQSCEAILEDAGYELHLAATPEAGLATLRRHPCDLALVDFKLPGMTGFEVLQQAAQIDPDVVLIMFTGYATFDGAVEAVKRGAFHYIAKPFTSAQLLDVVAKGLEHSRAAREMLPLREALAQCCPLHQIVGHSEALTEVLNRVAKVAPTGANVLITGPSGTGKELVARALHANSNRKDKPFIAVDCAALPSNLLESELFGHEKGAFTGASQSKRGLLEAADGGTLYFDEIGEMNAELQAKLLRTLQERSFRRLGSERLIDVDVRVVCSTNRNLPEEAKAGRFRPDLLYRLQVVTITLPALRERVGDIPLLVEHFVRMFAKAANQGKVQVSLDAEQLLESYAWPGNVRELRNVIEHAVVMCDGALIRPRDLPEIIMASSAITAPGQIGYKAARGQWVDAQGKQYLTSLLRRHDGNVSAAAREAQISRKSLYELMKRFDIDARESEAASLGEPSVTPA
ncbi:MAG TPA: sigma-54 dependent transcriptional regulator [Terriglobales bacterium]|nr:sigma-54 dependent transcriptional regulator [Terriglobales bacterium]